MSDYLSRELNSDVKLVCCSTTSDDLTTVRILHLRSSHCRRWRNFCGSCALVRLIIRSPQPSSSSRWVRHDLLYVIDEIHCTDQSILQKNDDRPASSSHDHPLLETLANDSDRFGLRLIPSLPLEPSTAPHFSDLDIVAVHGLGGDLYKTWTHSSNIEGENDVFWLSQLLPMDLPGARVYSFGYESRPAFSRSVATIREFAKQLLQLLLDREKAVRRLSDTLFDQLIVVQGQNPSDDLHLSQSWRYRCQTSQKQTVLLLANVLTCV